MYYLLMPSLDTRQALISFLKARGILSVFHYLPLHLSPVGQRMGGRTGDCPVAEAKSDRLVRLPFHNALHETDQGKVIEAVRSFDSFSP
jgi:dTDP-4-amino-4,6-dideoxygalactose transaminase